MAATLPRFLLPRGGVSLSLYNNTIFRYQVRSLQAGPSCRYASNAAPPPKHTLLEKPSKFNPPSHPARRNRPPPKRYSGPPLSAPEIEAQKTKQYPHMMPPEGSVMYKFLTSRAIHVWISLGVLTSLAIFTFTTNFKRTSPFAHLLPASGTFLPHPITYISQCIEVYRMHTAHIAAITAEKRKKKVDDVQKRAQYRKAHGLDTDQGLGGWTAKGDEGSLGQVPKTDGAVGMEAASVTAAGTGEGNHSSGAKEDTYVNWEGKKKPIKRWLGIWT
ncbi:hypothetical protein MMC13_005176 [Lambiella insularis]|nr:hypothetical protein [Lambiella insularis]